MHLAGRICALGTRGPGSVFPGGGAARLTGPDVLGRLVPPQRSRSLGAQRPEPPPPPPPLQAPGTRNIARPAMASGPAGEGARGVGRRMAGGQPWPQSQLPADRLSCPTGAETRQRLLRTVKKEVGGEVGEGGGATLREGTVVAPLPGKSLKSGVATGRRERLP